MLEYVFISSRVDYCNSVLYGAIFCMTCKLQAILNAATRLIMALRGFEHIFPVLRDDLHWLLSEQRVAYKIALLVYKCCQWSAPS